MLLGGLGLSSIHFDPSKLGNFFNGMIGVLVGGPLGGVAAVAAEGGPLVESGDGFPWGTVAFVGGLVLGGAAIFGVSRLFE